MINASVEGLMVKTSAFVVNFLVIWSQIFVFHCLTDAAPQLFWKLNFGPPEVP